MSEEAEIDCPSPIDTLGTTVTTGAVWVVVTTTEVVMLLLVVPSWIPTPSVSLPGDAPATYLTVTPGNAEIHTPFGCLTPLTVK